MTPLGLHLTVFLREYLPSQREMSVQTCDTYAYAFQLLVCFAAKRLKTTPSALLIEQLDATLVLAFLEHLEKERGNCARTRNSRLAAIKTFFRFLEYRLPSCLEQARRIRAVPVKKTDEVIIGYLNREEIQALLDAPDPSSRDGLRDRAMLHLAFAGGLRVSELVGLCLADLALQLRQGGTCSDDTEIPPEILTETRSFLIQLAKKRAIDETPAALSEEAGKLAETILEKADSVKVMVFCFLRIRLNCEKGALKSVISQTRGNGAYRAGPCSKLYNRQLQA